MKELSLSQLAETIARSAGKVRFETELAVVAIAKDIQSTAKEKIGTYQNESHGFNAWAPLAESTMQQREKLGYTANDPLKRSGELQESITMRSDGNGAIVGTTEDVGLWMENGTEKIPPRPYLGPAAAEVMDKAGEIISPHLRSIFK